MIGLTFAPPRISFFLVEHSTANFILPKITVRTHKATRLPFLPFLPKAEAGDFCLSCHSFFPPGEGHKKLEQQLLSFVSSLAFCDSFEGFSWPVSFPSSTCPISIASIKLHNFSTFGCRVKMDPHATAVNKLIQCCKIKCAHQQH